MTDAGEAFLLIEHQTQCLYVVADALLDGIQGLEIIGKKFFGVDDLDQNPVPAGLLDVDKEEFVERVLRNFVSASIVVCSHARKMYGFESTSGAD